MDVGARSRRGGRDDRRRTARSPTRRARCSTCSSATCPTPTLFLAHLDRGHNIHRIVDTRGGESFGLRSNQAMPLRDSFCWHMAEDLGPRRCDDVARRRRSTRGSTLQQQLGARLLPRRAARAVRRHAGRQPGRALAHAVALHRRRRAAVRRARPRAVVRARAREPTRDLRGFNDAARARPRARARSAAWPRRSPARDDARPAVCAAACEVTAAPVAFLLEPSGREFVSTAMVGVDIAPVTIQPRAASRSTAAARSRAQELLRRRRAQPPGARGAAGRGDRRALGAVRAGAARRQVAGVLIVIWRHAVEALPDARRRHAAAARRAGRGGDRARGLRARVGALALTDPLTGLGTRRMWDEELPRELARARRSESPVVDRGDRPRPHERVQHAARRARGRPPGQGDRRARGARAARGRHARPARRRRVRRRSCPDCGLGEACDVLDRVRARDPARADRLGGRRALGRRGAGRAAARPLRRTRSRPPSRPGAT